MAPNVPATRDRLVRLTIDDVREAARGAVERTLAAYRRGWQRGPSDPVYGRWEDDIRGALGEMAVCRALGITWDATVGRLDATDAGPFQVRSTHHPNGSLILQPHETTSDAPFILVTGDGLDYVVRGWIVGRAGNRDAWRRTKDLRNGRDRVAYFVPQPALWPLDTLPAPGPSHVPKVGNIPTSIPPAIAERVAAAAGAAPDLKYCPVCWEPERLDDNGRVQAPVHDPHKHAFDLARG